jgi:hypothetical protein
MPISRNEYRDRVLSHKLSVKAGIQRVVDELSTRGEHHDDDKLEQETFEKFYQTTEKFNGCEFGSPEYTQSLLELKPILDVHYGKNPHHPEHRENGINGMTLIDIMEMLIDWKSASSAYGDSFEKSLEVTKKRFNIDDQLFQILENTAKYLGYI